MNTKTLLMVAGGAVALMAFGPCLKKLIGGCAGCGAAKPLPALSSAPTAGESIAIAEPDEDQTASGFSEPPDGASSPAGGDFPDAAGVFQ